MPDVYSEEFARGIEQAAETQCAPLQDDPWLLGYFLGNEPPWPRRESELVDMFLKGPDTATQRKLKEYLAQGDTPKRREEFVYGMFERYLTLMGEAIKKADPNHLNLGIRFGGMPEEAILRMGKAFDVCSINVYEYEPTTQLKRIYEVTGTARPHRGVPLRRAGRRPGRGPGPDRRSDGAGQGIPLLHGTGRGPALFRRGALVPVDGRAGPWTDGRRELQYRIRGRHEPALPGAGGGGPADARGCPTSTPARRRRSRSGPRRPSTGRPLRPGIDFISGTVARSTSTQFAGPGISPTKSGTEYWS